MRTPRGEMTGRQVLEGAVEVIHRQGWYQGWYQADSGAVCMIGAIRTAAGLDPLDEMDYLTLGPAIDCVRDEIGDKDVSIPDWNDEPGRTVEDVLLVLKRAAEKA